MRKVLIALLLVPVAVAAESRAKNVILFLADAGGMSTIDAASLHGYGAPRTPVRAAHAEHRAVGHVERLAASSPTPPPA